MRNTIMTMFLLLWAGLVGAADASTMRTFCDRNVNRTGIEAIKLLVSHSQACPHADLYKKEVGDKQQISFETLHTAALECERGATCRLETRRCGTCRILTARVLGGRADYWRQVAEHEMVLYYDGVPVMLPECVNSVINLEPRIVEKIVQVPIPQPAPPPPLTVEKKAVLPEGCVEGPVQYTVIYHPYPTQMPIPWVPYQTWTLPYGVSPGGGYYIVTDHHEVKCFMNVPEPEEDKR